MTVPHDTKCCGSCGCGGGCRFAQAATDHDVSLVEALEYIVLKAACGASAQELSQAAAAALEEAKS